jgi:hypothetical protein
MSTIRNILISAVFLALSSAGTSSADSDWYFTASEIETAYRYQTYFGRRLQNPLKPNACYFGKSEFTASFRGREFIAPCRFIADTTRHLKLMIEKGAARYLFPLDADHAHLAIPTEVWERKYSKLSVDEVFPQILWEPELVALYHTAEHLAVHDSKSDAEIYQTKDWHAKRNVLGYFNGGPIRILPTRADGSAHHKPEQYENVASFYFLAHRFGELTVVVNEKAISLDMSFDEDYAVVNPEEIRLQSQSRESRWKD